MCFARGDVFLEENRGIAEARAGLALRFVEQSVEVGRLVHHAHAAPAAAERRLDDERKADLLRDSRAPPSGRVTGSSVPGSVGTLSFCGQRAGRRLVAHHLEQLRARPDESDARLAHRPARIRRSPRENRSPGWIRSTPFSFARATMPSMSR